MTQLFAELTAYTRPVSHPLFPLFLLTEKQRLAHSGIGIMNKLKRKQDDMEDHDHSHAKKHKEVARLCSTCDEVLEELDVLSMLDEYHQHKRHSCIDCYYRQIEVRLDAGAWDSIYCLDCDGVLDYPAMKMVATEPLYER